MEYEKKSFGWGTFLGGALVGFMICSFLSNSTKTDICNAHNKIMDKTKYSVDKAMDGIAGDLGDKRYDYIEEKKGEIENIFFDSSNYDISFCKEEDYPEANPYR